MTIDTYVVGTSGKATILKDPDAVLDYTFDWTAWLDDVGDTIASTSVPVLSPTGIALDLTAPHGAGYLVVGKTVVVWLKQGLPGTTHRVTCRIVTTGGRTDDRSIYVKIKDR